MNKDMTIQGKIVSGVRKAAFFTQLDWVQNQCRDKLGFKPYPGTLNLEIDEETLSAIEALKKEEDGVCLTPVDPQFCEAVVWAVSVGDFPGALIVPSEDVRVHGKHIIEILSPVGLKESLKVNDGDTLTIELKGTKTNP